jgi:hypothetical protein
LTDTSLSTIYREYIDCLNRKDWARRGDTLQLPFNDPNLDKEATTNGPEAQMKVKIFERSGEPGRLEREINDFLATLGPGAVLNTQTAIAAVRNENEQIETEYVVTIWYE